MEISHVPLGWFERTIIGFAIACAAALCSAFWYVLHLLIVWAT